MSNAHSQQAVDKVKERLRMGEITAAQANVQMVLIERVRLIDGRLSSDVRGALNGAVKAGILGRLPKKGLAPEVYYSPTFEYLARGERADVERRANEAIARVAGWK